MIKGIKYIEGTPSIISVETLQSSRLSILILQILIVIFLLIPITATIFAKLMLELKPAILFTYLIFWATGYYFLKLYLWNKYGKEIFYLEKEKLIYIADYRLFKGNKKVITSKDIKIQIQNTEGEIANLGTLTISDGNLTIESVLKVPINELVELKNVIEKYYA